ncbi:MAG: hypothetical protein Q9191_004729 [Dirinaria sp. TL-2023a]
MRRKDMRILTWGPLEPECRLDMGLVVCMVGLEKDSHLVVQYKDKPHLESLVFQRLLGILKKHNQKLEHRLREKGSRHPEDSPGDSQKQKGSLNLEGIQEVGKEDTLTDRNIHLLWKGIRLGDLA